MPRTRRHRADRRDAVRLFNRLMLALPVVIGVAAAIWLGFFATPSSARLLERFRVKVGSPVPYVQLRDRAGAPLTLASAATGQPTVVLISDADCVHCENQVRMIKLLGAERGGSPRLVGVSVSKEGRYPAMAATYAPIPLYDDVNGAFRGKLGLEAVPAMMSVDAHGRVRDIRFGLQNSAQLRALLDSAAVPARLTSAAGSSGR